MGTVGGSRATHESAAGPAEREAERTWRALARRLTGVGLMRQRRYSRVEGRHIYPPYDEEVTAELPLRPAALRLYDLAGRTWALGLDFDAKHHGAVVVERHAAEAAAYLTRLGARVVTDVAVSGGRHVWVPLAEPATVDQVRQLVAALHTRWPSLDTSSAGNVTDGCLTAPGSPCKNRSYRRLTMPLDDAVDAVTRRSAPGLVQRALTALGPLPSPARATTPIGDDEPVVAGGARALSAIHHTIARDGTWPAGRRRPDGQLWTRSEACYAVLSAAALSGYTLTQVLDNMEPADGTPARWPGLLQMYTGRYGTAWRRRIHAEWHKATTSARNRSATPPRETPTTGGTPTPAFVKANRAAERDYIRQWVTTMYVVIDDLVPGRHRHNARALVHGLAYLAWRVGNRTVEFGTRSISRACAGMMDHTVVADILRTLRQLPDDRCPIRRQAARRGSRADLLELVIPTAYSDVAADPRTWVCAPRPIPSVFGVRDPQHGGRRLGAPGWRLHQALAAGAAGTPAQLARAAGISRTEAYTLLPVLVRHGLARQVPSPATGSRWQVGHTSVRVAGQAADGTAHLAALDARHRRERAAWRAALARRAAVFHRRVTTVPQPREPLWWPADWTAASPAPDGPAVCDVDPHADALAVLRATFGLVTEVRPDADRAPDVRARWLRRPAGRTRRTSARRVVGERG